MDLASRHISSRYVRIFAHTHRRYTLRRKSFFRNLGSIVAFAVVGTLVSTFMIGYLVLAAGRAGLIVVDTQDPMEALLFGALISAVDPVWVRDFVAYVFE